MDRHFTYPGTEAGLERVQADYTSLRLGLERAGYEQPFSQDLMSSATIEGHEQPIDQSFVGFHASGRVAVLLLISYGIHLAIA